MRTTWRVEKVTEQASVTADLVRVSWFKTNPEWIVHSDEIGWGGEEFVDAEPGEEGAEYIDAGGRMTIDLDGDLDLHYGDDVAIEVRLVSLVRT